MSIELQDRPGEQTSTPARPPVRNQIVWCDVPVINLHRAVEFYSAMLGAPVQKQEYEDMAFALLPYEEGAVSGCLTPGSPTEQDPSRPSTQGPLLYFNCQGRLDQAIAAVESHGGKVLQPRHQIGPHGFRALVLDSEGNRIALHSM